MQGTQVRHLVRELRSRVPQGNLAYMTQVEEPACHNRDAAQPK